MLTQDKTNISLLKAVFIWSAISLTMQIVTGADSLAAPVPAEVEESAKEAELTPPTDLKWAGPRSQRSETKLPTASVPEARPTIDVIVQPLPPLDTPSSDQIERNAIRVVATPPTYPKSAGGVEGFVVVEFDITPKGTVENAVVVESQPARIFDRSALTAVQQWKYQPKMIDGEPVTDYGVRQRIDYEVADD